MTEKNWQELLVWTFRGERFEEKGIDLRDLENLVHLRAALVELAKLVWKERNPTRERAPKNADDTLELRVFGFDPGSCKVPVYYAAPRPPVQSTWLEPRQDPLDIRTALPEAARRTSSALRHLSDHRRFPDDFPPSVLSDLQTAVTTGLGADESIEIDVVRPKTLGRFLGTFFEGVPEGAQPPDVVAARDASPVVVDAPLREVVAQAVTETATTHRIVTGEVTMANVKGCSATLHADGYDLRIEFPPDREVDVTTALHKHRSVELRVSGTGEIDLRTGRLKKLVAHDLEIVQPVDPEAPSEALFERLASDDPPRLLALLASDLEPAMLTFAAEIAGRELSSEDVVPPLMALLRHPSAVVREGAIYGLAHHPRDDVDRELLRLGADDPSTGVRTAANDVLEGR